MEWIDILQVLGVASIISFLFQIIFTKLTDKRNKNKNTDDALRRGVQALLRNQLLNDYKTFIRQGQIDISDRENFENMYQSYHNLGKNGVMDSLHDQVMSLPINKK